MKKKRDNIQNAILEHDSSSNEYIYSLVGNLANVTILTDKINAAGIVDAYEKVLEVLNKINEHILDEDEKFIIKSIELVMEK